MNTRDREKITSRISEIDDELCRSDTHRNPSKIRSLTAERADLVKIQEVLEELDRIVSEIAEMKTVLAENDPEL